MQPIASIAALVVMVLVAIACECLWARRRNRLFKERFSPMSDEEFVQQCGAGTNPEIALRVRRIVSDQLGVEYERVHPSSSFVNDLGAE
jgi:hypothetical protein